MIKADALIPKIGVVTDIRTDTPDVKTFRVTAVGGGKCFEHIPGQCAMLSIPGAGEGMFSITSSPTVKDYMEFSIKKCGCLTEWLHQMEVGQEITIRGPYGNGFPVDTTFRGKDLIFIAGGIGLAPLRSVIDYCRANRGNYGTLDIVYGSRSKDDLVDFDEIVNEWSKEQGIRLSDHRPPAGRLGRSRRFCAELRQGTELRQHQDRDHLRPADYDQIHARRPSGAGFSEKKHFYHYGNAHEMRHREMRPLQYRFKIRL